MLNSLPVATTNTVGEGFGGRVGRVIGKLFGRRIVKAGDELLIPDTREGKALRVLIAGSGGCAPVHLDLIYDRVDALLELRDLLESIVGSLRPELDATRRALIDCGVKEPALSQLSSDEWCTPSRVMDMWNAIKHSFDYRWANNPQGVLVASLRSHQEIQEPGQDPDGWAYVNGKYKDEIEY